MAQVCSRCGGTSFHYNRVRMRRECSFCGTPISDMQEEQQLMMYDRSYAQAVGHLRAGNWNQTIDILLPFLNQYPTDQRIYIAVLRASTMDFQDLNMENSRMRSIASDTWNKLMRLNGITPEMIQYSRKRYEKHINELMHQRNIILVWIFMMSILCVILGVAINQSELFGIIVSALCLIFCINRLVKEQPLSVISQLSGDSTDYKDNPFI